MWTHTGPWHRCEGVRLVCLIGFNSPLALLSHFSTPPPPFFFLLPLRSSHPLNLPPKKHLISSSFPHSKMQFFLFYSLILPSFDNGSFSPHLIVFILPLGPNTSFHTNTQIQRNFRNVPVPAASCCSSTYDCTPESEECECFSRADRCMDGGIEWLMKKWDTDDPALRTSSKGKQHGGNSAKSSTHIFTMKSRKL